MVDFPNVFVKEIKDKNRTNTDKAEAHKALSQAYKGVCDKDGNLKVNPGFIIQKLDVGKYKITHNIGYEHLSLSVSLLEGPGTAQASTHDSKYFIVETSENGKPTDKGFSFTLIKAVS